jgi:hypothetical protein
MAKKESSDKKAKPAGITDKERIDKGQVLARIIIEVLGAPKSYVEEAIGLVVDRVHATKDIYVVSESTFEAEEKGQLFSTFSELEIWFGNMDTLSNFLFEFTPSSIEVMQPSKIQLDARFVSGFFNDFLLKMHELGLKLKDTAAKTQLLQKNADALVRNFMNFVLSQGPKSVDEVTSSTGIPRDNIAAILSNFEKAGLVKKEGEKYILLKKKQK